MNILWYISFVSFVQLCGQMLCFFSIRAKLAFIVSNSLNFLFIQNGCDSIEEGNGFVILSLTEWASEHVWMCLRALLFFFALFLLLFQLVVKTFVLIGCRRKMLFYCKHFTQNHTHTHSILYEAWSQRAYVWCWYFNETWPNFSIF